MMSLKVGNLQPWYRDGLCIAPVAQWIAHQTSNLGVAGSSPAWGISFCHSEALQKKKEREASTEQRGQHVRVVKESDLKSDGLCPRRFKSCCCRVFDFDVVVAIIFACLLAIGALYP